MKTSLFLYIPINFKGKDLYIFKFFYFSSILRNPKFPIPY